MSSSQSYLRLGVWSRPRGPAAVLLWAASLALALCARGAGAACAAASHRADINSSYPVFLVGQSAPLTGPWASLGLRAQAGLKLALDSANDLSRLQYQFITLDDEKNDTQQAVNTRTLVCDQGVFAVTASVGNVAAELAYAVLNASMGPDLVPVPFIGAFSGSTSLRTRANVISDNPGNSTVREQQRTGVAMVRAGGLDELSAIVFYLSYNWDTLQATSVLCQDTVTGERVRTYVDSVLKTLGGSGLFSFGTFDAAVGDQGDSAIAAAAKTAADAITRGGKVVPRAVILAGLGEVAGAFVREMASRKITGVKYIACTSAVSVEQSSVLSQLGSSALATLSYNLSSSLYFMRSVPFKNGSYLMSMVQKLMTKYNTTQNITAELVEGFIAGRLMTLAAERALDENGWPLTRANFLDALFRAQRTFTIFDVVLGPYGDGWGSSHALQSTDEFCNQGSHEIYLSKVQGDGTFIEVPEGTLKWVGCSVMNWTASKRSIVGVSADTGDTTGTAVSQVLSGIRYSINEYSGDNTEAKPLLPVSVTGNTSYVVSSLLSHSPVMILGCAGETAVAAAALLTKAHSSVPLVAPFSSAVSLRTPFQRKVVNIFASAYQEMEVTLNFLAERLNMTSVALIRKDQNHSLDYSLGISKSLAIANRSWRFIEGFMNSTDSAAEFIKFSPDAIIFAGNDELAEEYVGVVLPLIVTNSTIVFTSELAPEYLDSLLTKYSSSIPSDMPIYQSQVVPPLSALSTSDTTIELYSEWVSSYAQTEATFRGFLASKFAEKVLDSIDKDTDVTASSFLDALYSQQVFTIGQLTFGPFDDSCSSSDSRCCNQGSDLVYFSRWVPATSDLHTLTSRGVDRRSTISLTNWAFIEYMSPELQCGAEFDEKTSKKDNTAKVLGLSIGIPVGVVFIVAALLAALIVWKLKNNFDFLNIKASDIEINELLGKGRFGALHLGDWHGTSVAVRVIEKKEASPEDLKLVKEEVELLYKLHHPNLLMLMGFCETKTQLLVVGEFCGNGNLATFLIKNKMMLNVFQHISLAYDVVKGLAYLHAAKPQIVHGSVTTRCLLVDEKMTVKLSDFWGYSRGGKVSSGGSRKRNRFYGGWVAPEILANQPVTAATDVYTFGLILWELFLPLQQFLELEASVNSSTNSSVQKSGSKSGNISLDKLPKGDHPDLVMGTPNEVAELLLRCWQPDPGQRPTIFQILRSWPATFGAFGAFELPSDLPSSSSGVTGQPGCDPNATMTPSYSQGLSTVSPGVAIDMPPVYQDQGVATAKNPDQIGAATPAAAGKEHTENESDVSSPPMAPV